MLFWKCIIIHKNKYDYQLVNYVSNRNKVKIICSKHGIFEQSYDRHLNQKSKCPKCSQLHGNNLKRDSLETFIKKANNIFNNKYDYSKFVYKGNKVHGIVHCNTCGHEWNVRPDLHLATDSKRGCPKCKVNAIYTKEYYERHDIQDHECSLYIVQFIERQTKETFIKIGITKHKNIKTRFRGLHDKYIITTLYQKDTMFYEAYESEQRLQKLVKNYAYVPNDKFKGYTECFNIKCLDNLQSSLGVILEVKSP